MLIKPDSHTTTVAGFKDTASCSQETQETKDTDSMDDGRTKLYVGSFWLKFQWEWFECNLSDLIDEAKTRIPTTDERKKQWKSQRNARASRAHTDTSSNTNKRQKSSSEHPFK